MTYMTIAEAPALLDRPRRFRRIARRVVKAAGIAIAALLIAGTAASFGYNLATDGPAPRPAHLLFARLGPVLAANHRVFAIDLSGTGYSAPNPPFSAGHLAAQIRAFLATEKLTGPDAPILVGHSAGAADVGIAALYRPGAVNGVVFLDGDATPLGIPSFPGAIASTLLINPYKTSLLRLALSQDWLIKDIYAANCGPTCPQLEEAGVNTWRWPLEQPGFQAEISYTLRHGITAMTAAQFAALKAADLPKLVVAGTGDPQIPHSDAALTARRIGAPAPVYVPGRHLTMISSPRQVAAAIDSLRPGPPG